MKVLKNKRPIRAIHLETSQIMDKKKEHIFDICSFSLDY